MTSSLILNSNGIASPYFNNSVSDQDSSRSDWFEFIREHSKARPAIPGSDFLVARSYTSESSDNSRRSCASAKEGKESDDREDIMKVDPAMSERWSKIRHRQLKSNNSTWSGSSSTPPSFEASQSFSSAKTKSMNRSLQTLQSYNFSHGERNTDPMLWTFAENSRDASITVHRPVSFSPGPKYALQPIVVNSQQRRMTSSTSLQDTRSSFSRDSRMTREHSRSPGPKYSPMDPKGVASQNYKGAPRLHGQGRELFGSPYNTELTSSGTTAIYDTMQNFSVESKRISQKNVFVGRPSTDCYDKSPPLRLNSRA